MIGQIAVVSATFVSVSVALTAIGLLLRDLFGTREEPKRRLELVPEIPEGNLNEKFYRLIDESGTTLDATAALMVVVGGVVLGAGIPLVLFDSLLGAAGGMVVGAALPLIYFSVIRWWRLGQMRRALPQALQAVADAVRSGQTLSEACELVSKEIKGPLGDEFAYAYQQLELGQAPIAVMNRMVRRIPLSEFRMFATAVVVHRRAGGNLSLLTERMSRAALDRQDVRNHLMAVTSGSRLSAIGMAVGGVIAMGLLTWLEPEYVQAFVSNEKGPWLLAVAIGLEVIGALWCWRILKSNY